MKTSDEDMPRYEPCDDWCQYDDCPRATVFNEIARHWVSPQVTPRHTAVLSGWHLSESVLCLRVNGGSDEER